MSILLTKNALLGLLVFLMVSSSFAAQESAIAIRDIKDTEVDERGLREAVASRTLTWLTGSSSNNDYVSVGRIANYFGFVALRVSSGQSLTRSNVANDALAVLNKSQRDALIALLQDQKISFKNTQVARHAMNRALEGLQVGEKISRDAFIVLGRAYGESEAMLGHVIAQRLGDVAQTLKPDQKTSLAGIRATHISGQGKKVARKGLKLKLSQEDKQELVNIAARFLSWTTGSQEFNDFEVVGKPSQHFGFVSLRLESNHSVRRGEVAKEVWSMLTSEQQQMLNVAAAHDIKEFRKFLMERGRLMRTLEMALAGNVINADDVSRFGAAVGELEASMTWSQAMAMLQVRDSMTEAQATDLLAMRNKYVVSESNSPTIDPIERGRQLFAQCALCHDMTESRATGPNLNGVVGRKIASDTTYESYSPAMRTYANTGGMWSEPLLDHFLKSPRSLVSGTTMGFTGLEKEYDRAALIAYLKSKVE